MNERFIRCSECGMPHEEQLRTCPATGRAIVRGASGARSGPSGRPPPATFRPTASPNSGAPPTALPRPGRDSVDFELVGTLIGGKYRVREILGQGGMGTVFEALHEGLGSLVAIKVLHPNQLQKRDAVQRFHHEARAAARIGHPNICEVHDAGTLTDGRPFLVMERLSGVTLADRIRAQGGLPFQEVLDTVTQVLSGLHAAHEKGILHRDVKPENVFLSERVGCPPLAKLLDFGVSKVMAEHAGAGGFSEVEVTRTGVVLGTPYYLAPEQARGERNLDPRVDLYACGILLYEALTARRPFRAANYNALLINILTTKPRPARELRPDLPAGFSRVLDKSIERDPAARFQTALEFQAAIAAFLAVAPGDARSLARAGAALDRLPVGLRRAPSRSHPARPARFSGAGRARERGEPRGSPRERFERGADREGSGARFRAAAPVGPRALRRGPGSASPRSEAQHVGWLGAACSTPGRRCPGGEGTVGHIVATSRVVGRSADVFLVEEDEPGLRQSGHGGRPAPHVRPFPQALGAAPRASVAASAEVVVRG